MLTAIMKMLNMRTTKIIREVVREKKLCDIEVDKSFLSIQRYMSDTRRTVQRELERGINGVI
jgi:hypothetical protein